MSPERGNNPDHRARVGRTCSGKPRFDHGRGRIASNGTGKRWRGEVHKCPLKKYRRARNNYIGRATANNTTGTTGTATCRGGRHTHSSGSAKGRSCREIVGNERFSKEGGAGKAARIEGSGVGATRCGPHYDEANHLGASCWKVAHHQGGTFGEQVF